MTTKLYLGLDTNHNVTYELPVSDTIASTTLTANVAQTLTIPPKMTRAFFSFSNGTDVYVAFDNVTPSLPGNSFSFSQQELNPVARHHLVPGSTLGFISPTASYVNIAFFTDNINGY